MGQKNPKSICSFGAAYMLKQVINLEYDIGDALAGRDIEAIHRMRVSSRRLRNSTDLFKDCFSGKKAKAWNDEIRKITRALGNARDLDIQIKFINQAYEESLETTYKPGYRRLLLRLKQSRVKAQEKVNKTIRKMKKKEVLGQMSGYLAGLIDDNTATPLIDPCLYDIAFQAIDRAVEDFLSYQSFIHSSENADKLHAMRIAGKHLRYSMEAFASLYDLALNPYIHVMREIQDQLGAFHDNDVWVSWLPKFIKKEQARIEDYFGNTGPLERLLPGLEHLLEDRIDAREKVHQTFLNTWHILEGENAWEVLRGILKGFVHDEVAEEGVTVSPEAVMEHGDEDEDRDQIEFEVELMPDSEGDPQNIPEETIQDL